LFDYVTAHSLSYSAHILPTSSLVYRIIFSVRCFGLPITYGFSLLPRDSVPVFGIFSRVIDGSMIAIHIIFEDRAVHI
jgi:hypothetical protein